MDIFTIISLSIFGIAAVIGMLAIHFVWKNVRRGIIVILIILGIAWLLHLISPQVWSNVIRPLQKSLWPDL